MNKMMQVAGVAAIWLAFATAAQAMEIVVEPETPVTNKWVTFIVNGCEDCVDMHYVYTRRDEAGRFDECKGCTTFGAFTFGKVRPQSTSFRQPGVYRVSVTGWRDAGDHAEFIELSKEFAMAESDPIALKLEREKANYINETFGFEFHYPISRRLPDGSLAENSVQHVNGSAFPLQFYSRDVGLAVLVEHAPANASDPRAFLEQQGGAEASGSPIRETQIGDVPAVLWEYEDNGEARTEIVMERDGLIYRLVSFGHLSDADKHAPIRVALDSWKFFRDIATYRNEEFGFEFRYSKYGQSNDGVWRENSVYVQEELIPSTPLDLTWYRTNVSLVAHDKPADFSTLRAHLYQECRDMAEQMEYDRERYIIRNAGIWQNRWNMIANDTFPIATTWTCRPFR